LFTGIVEELGQVVSIAKNADESARIVIAGPTVTSDTRGGDSICVNGVCLTVVDLDGGTFSADLMAETLRRTTLGSMSAGDQVNLERAMPADGRFGGHIVSGHIDGSGHIRSRRPSANWEIFEISIPPQLCRFVVRQGSITLDGVSLTVVQMQDGPDPWFSVSLIPTTLRDTTFGSRSVGVAVNIEVDVIGKYVERLMAVPA
jgi:riboflavin synthase